EASATNYTLWIHGRNTSGSTQAGNYNDFSYWGSSSTAGGVNKKNVNRDRRSKISAANDKNPKELDYSITRPHIFYNTPHTAPHRAGDGQIGYALAMYGGRTRNVKNASPAADGTCGNTGTTQTGWNIKWVDIASGAGGGSELANIGSWAVSDPLTDDLKTGT